MKKSDIKIHPHTTAGSFGRINNGKVDPYSVINCREIFAGHFKKETKAFVFYHENSAQNLELFFQKIEDKLKLNKRTRFEETELKNAVVVHPAMFWRMYKTRQELFTILLRSAQGYDAKKDNFDKALFSDNYSKITRRAVVHFLNGNTIFKKGTKLHHTGWRDRFSGMKTAQLREYLIPFNKDAVKVDVGAAIAE